MKRYSCIICLLLSVFCVRVSAQSLEPLPYRCDFSNQVEAAKWQLNVGNTAAFENKWYIGDKGGATHREMLYISGDGGATAGYTSKDNMVVTYREFDMAAGTYDVAFDWRALGKDSSAACMHVVWSPESYDVIGRIVSLNFYTGETSLPSWVKTYNLTMNKTDKMLYGREDWTHATSKLVCPTAGKYRLSFVWVNKNASSIFPPGGCVDNLEMAKAACGKPENLKALGSFTTVSFTWDGTAEEYEMMYTPMDSAKWTVVEDIKNNSLVLNGLPKGIYEVRLRAICGGDTTIWEHFPMTYVYEAQCLDYLDIKSGYCTHGSFDNPYEHDECVDKGYKSIYSSHTIHYRQEEYDPRTLGKLKTVPDGAVASVRLGNWGTGSRAESITYDYTVDADLASIMLLKYAVVLEDPGHSENSQPRFRLEVLDGKGNLVDDLCGVADFKALSNRDGWVTIPASSSLSNTVVVWKDWSTVGLNLEDYDGQTLKIRLTIYDCNQGGHYGYAYFTIGCAVGTLEGMNCGEYPTTEFIAPEGFLYRWYKEGSADTDTLSKERIFPVEPSDRTHYLVDVVYPTESRCKFTLKASAIPRFPEAGMTMKHTPVECRNYMTFSDTSCIVTDEGIASHDVDAVYWNFGNGRTSMDGDVRMEFPKEGYKYDSCYLVASLCDDLCTDTLWFKLDVPAIGSVTVETDAVFCAGDSLFVESDTITAPGDYRYEYTSVFSGCDSTVVYHVEENPTYHVYDTVSIVRGDKYEFGTQTLTETGDYTETFRSAADCDSVVDLYLRVLMLLDVESADMSEICHDQEKIVVPFTIVEGEPQEGKFIFDDYARRVGRFSDIDVSYNVGQDYFEIPMPDSILPGMYHAQLAFYDGVIGRDTIAVTLDVKYSTSVLTQRWSDVIAVKNSEHNNVGGVGFDFSAFQWFVNGDSVAGASNSIFYSTDGLDVQSLYSVLLTRRSDGVAQYTCLFSPADLSMVDSEPTVYFGGTTQSVSVPEYVGGNRVDIAIYTLDGLLVGRYSFSSSDQVQILMPSEAGIYLMEMVLGDWRNTRKIVIK